MTIYDYTATGRTSAKNSLSSCAMKLLGRHTIALRHEARTAAVIIPWAAVEYLGGKAHYDQYKFLDDAVRLSCAPAVPASGPSGKTGRHNLGELIKNWERVLSDVQAGAMVTFVNSKKPVGLFVPVMVLQKLAGRSLPGECEKRLQAGISNVLRLEQAAHEWRYTAPAQRVSRGLQNPLMPV